ncbi:hypothetical protein WG904_18755 [Pedobacter sp. Du54]|uniref:hypothetical protein n=1 Tax=Pedobacter anseongensis TaxID=3133439 RepID=UPI0030981598
MALEKKKTDRKESNAIKVPQTPKIEVDDIDLGDADGSSSNSGMDNFKQKESVEFPNNRGRIDDL